MKYILENNYFFENNNKQMNKKWKFIYKIKEKILNLYFAYIIIYYTRNKMIFYNFL